MNRLRRESGASLAFKAEKVAVMMPSGDILVRPVQLKCLVPSTLLVPDPVCRAVTTGVEEAGAGGLVPASRQREDGHWCSRPG